MSIYNDVLDMELDHKKRLDDCWLYFLTDEDGTTQLELTYNDETPDGGYELGSGFGHLAFSVDSLDKFTEKMNELGEGGYIRDHSRAYEPLQLKS